MSARDDVLGRIAAAHAIAPSNDAGYEAIVRTYRTTSAADAAELTERLIDRLIDYKALVRRCPPELVAATIAEALAERRIADVVVPAGLDEAWLGAMPQPPRIDRPDEPLSVADLDAAAGVVTGCAVAVAETGTLILDASPDQGRRVITLIPDYHLCVVRPGQTVADVPQALHRLDPGRPLTMISGPSATSDIELNRVEGVHGPRTLEVIVVEG